MRSAAHKLLRNVASCAVDCERTEEDGSNMRSGLLHAQWIASCAQVAERWCIMISSVNVNQWGVIKGVIFKNCETRSCQHPLRSGIQTASLGVSEVPRVSPRAECREERKGDDQCLPCVCVVLVTRTGSMGVHPYSKETRVPRQPRGFPGVRVDCCWMTFLPFLECSCRFLLRAGVKNPPASLLFLILALCAFRSFGEKVPFQKVSHWCSSRPESSRVARPSS